MTLAPGTQLGPYAIVSQLGQGGMGVVYQAHDPRLDRRVAIKLLPLDLTRDETAKQRFLQEAQAASALDHPKARHVGWQSARLFSILPVDPNQGLTLRPQPAVRHHTSGQRLSFL